jgi:hypothetical protein
MTEFARAGEVGVANRLGEAVEDRFARKSVWGHVTNRR